MTWKEAKARYSPYRVYFRVVKRDVLRLPCKVIGGIVTCLPINQGFSKMPEDAEHLSYGWSSLSGPKAYRIAKTLDGAGVRYELLAHGVTNTGSELKPFTVKLLDTTGSEDNYDE